jgi:hypothetical protein
MFKEYMTEDGYLNITLLEYMTENGHLNITLLEYMTEDSYLNITLLIFLYTRTKLCSNNRPLSYIYIYIYYETTPLHRGRFFEHNFARVYDKG